MTRLATVADLNAVLGTSFGEADERPLRLLELASSLVQGEARQRLEVVEGDVITVPTDLTGFYLPERPVTDITAVLITPWNGLGYPLLVDNLAWTASGVVRALGGPLQWESVATVTYDHGYSVIPDDIVSLVCAIAGRMFTNPTRGESQSIMGYLQTAGDGGSVFPEAERQAIRAKYASGSGVSSSRIRGPYEL